CTKGDKELLEKCISETDKMLWILDYKEQHMTTTVDFTVKLSSESLKDSLEEGLEKRFMMSSLIGTSNMVCFDSEGRIRKYDSPEEILKEFYTQPRLLL
ncbi:8706_t:CDS:2, partial [Funneliformis geosporum]